MLDAGIEVLLEFELKKYQFVNTPVSRCVEEKEFFKCRKDCILKGYSEEFDCRFPYVSEIPKKPMPKCTAAHLKINESMSKLNTKATRKHIQINLTSCNCFPACRQLKYYIYPTGDVTTGINSTDFLLRLSKHGIPTVTQRLFYNLAELTGEIGGNLGLYIGWSFLSLFEFIFIFKNVRQEQLKLLKMDPIQKKVIAILHEEKRRKEKLSRQKCSKNFSTKKIIQITVIFLCISFFAFQVWAITIQYLSSPTVNVVSIKENYTLTFPILILCNSATKFLRSKINYLKKHHSKNRQEIDMVDLIDDHKNSIDKLWKRNEAVKDLIKVEDHLDKLDVSAIFPLKYDEAILPVGHCSRVEIGERIFTGTSAIYIAIWRIMPRINEEDIRWVYYNADDEDVDFLAPLILPVKKSVLVMFSVLEVHYLNTAANPCMPTLDAYSCRRRCINNEIPKLIPCRLPYMPSNNTIPYCNSSKIARDAQDIYFNFISHPLPAKCKCSRPCSKIIYKPVVIVELASKGMLDMNIFNFVSNVIEVIIEKYAYSRESYLANIGANLGLILGVSILTMFESITRLVKYIVKIL